MAVSLQKVWEEGKGGRRQLHNVNNNRDWANEKAGINILQSCHGAVITTEGSVKERNLLITLLPEKQIRAN